ncbi:hypothetical protein GON03_06855 [Nocardioides sp. MAH-18]|uniref:Uncharacterized protein n=1 Tax=Nocardioides agri TaxID=2682843 RepID=A0A6L6XQP7_9ACTN|nr:MULTISPECIES: hypothetical protein [unclassified Nocardioides]MBA2954033.1 hypothetical protein [Nocardioides sp. CGMCC 1.13656]MVQ48896.1 hypothetical protein [Nocardioides sp. MAH-18]
MRCSAAAALVATALLLTACSDDGGTTATPAPSPSRSIRTLTPLPVPEEPPPTGKLRADMRQSSRDAAAGRMEVWIDNDTAAEITPTKIVYTDPRFRRTLPGTRLRPIPSQSERGYPLYLPKQPACSHPKGRGTVTVTYGDTTKTIRVEDSTDVAGRYTGARCLEIAIGEVAALSWDDDVPSDGGEGDPGTLTLVVDTTGRPGPTLTIDTVSGTPVLSPDGSDVWRPDATIRGTDAPSRIDLPLKPTRCDAHAFAESGGATAFKIGLHLGGEPGQITLRMSVPGAKNAIDFARTSCGMLKTIED